MTGRYVAEELPSSSGMARAIAAEKNRVRGVRATPDENPAWAVVDTEARPRQDVAYGLRADMVFFAKAANEALQISDQRVA